MAKNQTKITSEPGKQEISSPANSMHRESLFLRHVRIHNLSRNGGDRDTFQPS